MTVELERDLRAAVVDRLALHRKSAEVVDLLEERVVARQIINEVLDEHARAAIVGSVDALDEAVEAEISTAIFDSIFGLGRLQRLLDDPSIENINANGCDVVFVRYADGTRERVGSIADSDAKLVEMIRNAAARVGPTERRFDSGSPYVDLHLPDGSRLAAVMQVSHRPGIAIRRHRYRNVTLEELVDIGMITLPVSMLLRAIVLGRKNAMVSGGTGAGKTTLLRALIAAIGSWERVITVENSRELAIQHLDSHDDVLSLEERNANVEGEGQITMAQLVRMGLRLSPDRVIVGEVIGPEVIAMLNAMGQGNDGSLSTIHAKSSLATFGRIATYAIQAEERFPPEATNLLIANALDFVIFISHDPASGRRFVSSIREVVGADGHMVVTNEVVKCDRAGNVTPGARLTEETEYLLSTVDFDASYFYDERNWL